MLLNKLIDIFAIIVISIATYTVLTDDLSQPIVSGALGYSLTYIIINFLKSFDDD